MQTFGYSPLKVQCTEILLDRMSLKNWGASSLEEEHIAELKGTLALFRADGT